MRWIRRHLTGHLGETCCVQTDLQTIDRQRGLDRGAPGGRGPVDREHPLRVIMEPRAHRQIREHRDPGGTEDIGGTTPGHHQQVRGADRPRAQHDAVRGVGHRTRRSERIDPHRPGTAEPDPLHPGRRVHDQVRPRQRGPEEGGTGTDPGAVAHVERQRTNSVGRPTPVQIVDPAKSSGQDGVYEKPCSHAELMRSADRYRPMLAVQRPAEVQVRLDRPEVRQYVVPGPAGYPPAREVRGHTPAEVAAVDRAGPTDHRAAHQVDLAAGRIGQRRRIPDDNRTTGTDRHQVRVPDLRRHRPRARLKHRDPAPGIG